jgi:hypothetical protein
METKDAKEQRFSSVHHKTPLEYASQLYLSPKLKGGNLVIVDSTLQSKCRLTTSLRATLLALEFLKGSFHCDNSLEGIIGDLSVVALFICPLHSCVENVICISKEMQGNEVHAFNFIENNDLHAPYPLQKPPLFLCALWSMLSSLNFDCYQEQMRKHDEWKEYWHVNLCFV